MIIAQPRTIRYTLVVRAFVLLIVLGGSALAAPPPSGVYQLKRRGEAALHYDKRGSQIPKCPTTESIPIPSSLRIEYSMGSSVVQINGEQWDVSGYADKAKTENPHQTAKKPGTLPRIAIWVSFRRSDGAADGLMSAVELDNRNMPVCTVTYVFEGTYHT